MVVEHGLGCETAANMCEACLAKSLAADRATFSGTPERIVGRWLRLLHCCLQLTEHSRLKVLAFWLLMCVREWNSPLSQVNG